MNTSYKSQSFCLYYLFLSKTGFQGSPSGRLFLLCPYGFPLGFLPCTVIQHIISILQLFFSSFFTTISMSCITSA